MFGNYSQPIETEGLEFLGFDGCQPGGVDIRKFGEERE